MKARALRWLAAAWWFGSAAALAADIGRVLLAAGEAVAVREQRVVRLALGSSVREGDVLRTGPASTLQVRFADESLLAMRENSEIRIEQFRFSGREDGTERAFFRLLKGGLRKVTGLIGRTRHENYRMSSVVGTIGIRGTDYATTLCQRDCRNPDGSLARDGQYGRVIGASSGTSRLAFSNQFERVFGISQNFYVADFKSEPQLLLEPPGFVGVPVRGAAKPQAGTGTEQAGAGGAAQDPRGTTPSPSPPELPQFIATEERTSAGSPAVIGDMPTMAGVGALFQPQTPTAPAQGGGFFRASDVTVSGSGTAQILLGFTAPAGSGAEPGGGSTVTGSAGSVANVINETQPNALGANWGRWTGGSFLDSTGLTTFSPTNQFHYLFGPLAPPDVVAAKSGSFPLSALSGTTPTNDLGETGTFLASGMNVNFTTRVVSATGFSFAFPSQNWLFGGIAAPIQFVAGRGAFIDAQAAGTCSSTASCGYPSPSVPAVLGVTGIFMGARGDHLGASFNAVTTSGPPAHASTTRLFSCAPSC